MQIACLYAIDFSGPENSEASSLRDRSLVAYRLPMTGSTDPDASVTVGAAEVLAELAALDIGASCDDGRVAIDANHHVGYVDGVVAKLSALSGGEGILLGCDLAERGNGDVVFRQRPLRKVGVAMEARFLGLPFHVYDLSNNFLFGVERRPGMNGNMLGGKSRQSQERGQQ
jgi:hypothetical protein